MPLSLAVAALLAATWIVYCVVLYPAIVSLLGKFRALPVRQSQGRSVRVTMIVTARNEEKSIAAKIENSLLSDYPPDKLNLLVVSDGSTDRTVECASVLAEKHPGRLEILAFEENRGKTAALMDGVERVRDSCDVVVFSDANSFFRSDAVSALVRNFGDETVGCVGGELRYRSVSGEKAYRGMENRIREWESRIGVSVGAEGAIYAARSTLVPRLSAELIDDFTIPLLIQASGHRVVYEPHAIAEEEFRLEWSQQFWRRKRIVNRCVRSSMQVPGLYNPFRAPLPSFAFVSHRMLRWLIGLPAATLLLIGLAASVAGWPWAIGAVASGGFIAWVLAGWMLRRWTGCPRVLQVGLFGASAVVAMLLGVVSALRGVKVVKWNPQRS